MAVELNKNNFIRDAQRFFESGLMRVVYQDDDMCICNSANHNYVVFDFHEDNGIQYGFIANAYLVQKTVESKITFYELISSLDLETLQKMIVPLNDQMFRLMQERKLKTDVNGPTKHINFEFEKELMELNKKGRNR